MPSVESWFPTLIYAERLQAARLPAFNASILRECYQIRDYDAAGRAWSDENYPGGYTSYGSLDQLHRFSSTFGELQEKVDVHVGAFARALHWNLQGGRLVMTDCWLNVMPRGCAHSFHLHPQAVVSGTYYVKTPPRSPGLKFEDPRLSRLMAAPPRKARANPRHHAHISYPARAGQVVLFESWLRHEVPPSKATEDRVSVSFNYHWVGR